MVESSRFDSITQQPQQEKKRQSGDKSTTVDNMQNSQAGYADMMSSRDQLRAGSDKQFTAQFMSPNQEVVIMSCTVSKFNEFSWKQERNLVITNTNLYNFKKKQLRRVIALQMVAGLTKSLYKTSKEFVVHVTNDFDVRYSSELREAIFNTIKVAYLSICKRNLPVFGLTKNKTLSDFTTTEKDLARGVSRIPLKLARLYNEDLLDESQVQSINQQSQAAQLQEQEQDHLMQSQQNFSQQQSVSPRKQSRPSNNSADIEMAQANEIQGTAEQLEKDMHRRVIAKKRQSGALQPMDTDDQFEDEAWLELMKKKDNDTSFDQVGDDRQPSTNLYTRETLRYCSFEDFTIVALVGKGNFGKVYLIQNQITGKYHAMKSIRKDIVLAHDSVENLENEKMILLQVNHPFIISMDYVFQKAYRIYFVMDFIQGGELFQQLAKQQRFSEVQAKFYAAQVALALGYLHQSQILYRDLKPENILIDADGYILLADFGLAKILVNDDGDDPNSFCGTPEYLAPEMINGSGHDHGVDWWALGILIYEMIIGIPPFYNSNKHKMYYFIQNAPIRWPTVDRHGIEASSLAKDLITKMLEKNKLKRLGSENDVLDILAHPWFGELDLEALLRKEIHAPFKPDAQSLKDLSNFNPDILSQPPSESMISQRDMAKVEQAPEAFNAFGPILPEKKSDIVQIQQAQAQQDEQMTD